MNLSLQQTEVLAQIYSKPSELSPTVSISPSAPLLRWLYPQIPNGSKVAINRSKATASWLQFQ